MTDEVLATLVYCVMYIHSVGTKVLLNFFCYCLHGSVYSWYLQGTLPQKEFFLQTFGDAT